MRWNYKKLTRSWKCYVLGLDSRQSSYCDSCRLAEQDRATSGDLSLCRQPQPVGRRSHGHGHWLPFLEHRVRSQYHGAKEASSPAAPVSDHAKASKIVSAGSGADDVDAPSSCHAGRQDSWLGIQSDAVRMLKPSAPGRSRGEGCLFLLPVNCLVLFWMLRWTNKYVFVFVVQEYCQISQICCETLEVFVPELIFWKYFSRVRSKLNL